MIHCSKLASPTRFILFALTMLSAARNGTAQNTPLISGGAGFFTNTTGGSTSYQPIIAPLAAVPIGNNFLIESRAAIVDELSPKGGDQPGYDHSFFAGLTYLQGDYIATSHVTVVGGTFLTPFGTYNERLSPIWINTLQDGPLIQSLGIMSTGVSLGGMLRGSAISRSKYSIDYAAYYSGSSSKQNFAAQHATGGRADLLFPEKHLEIGVSYGRRLQGTQENFYGSHLWWKIGDTPFRLRSEFARGRHAQGYWVEMDYRTAAHGGLDSWIGRLEPIVRMQQTFRRDSIVSDGLPLVNNQRIDFGLDYNLPHNTRVLTSYSRQFSSAKDFNIWETGIVYRFLFPAWKGK
jgi:hypothetical protein